MSLSDSGLISLTGQLSIGSFGGNGIGHKRHQFSRILQSKLSVHKLHCWMHRIDETQYFFQSQLLRLFNAKNKQCTLNQPTKIWKQKTDPTGNMRPGGLCLKAKIQLELCIWWKWSVVPISTIEYSQNGAKKDIDDWWLSSDFLGNSWSVVWACFKRSPFSVHLNFLV